MKYSQSWKIGLYQKVLSDETIYLEIKFPTNIWKIKELLIFLVIAKIVLFNYRKVDILNFHIAYPLLTYWHLIAPFFNKPVICNEHWTAYAKNFNMEDNKQSSDRLKNIKNIFSNDILFLTVSQYLANSIETFANRRINYKVLGNVVSNIFFHNQKVSRAQQTFFMAAVWRPGKDALTIIRVFKDLIVEYPNIKLRIAGTGDQFSDMLNLIKKIKLSNSITLLGALNKESIADEMQKATAFIHNSKFETFSVVCAESLSCGTPVIVSRLAAIEEYFRDGVDGFFVGVNNITEWRKSIEYFLDNINNFNHEEIANRSIGLFSKKMVGLKYIKILENRLSEKAN